MFTVQPMTEQEKIQLAELVDPAGSFDGSLFGKGGSIFDPDGNWIGGAAFKSTDELEREVFLEITPGAYVTGLWLHAWADLALMLTQDHNYFTMIGWDEQENKLYRKMGPYNSYPLNGPHCWFFMFNPMSINKWTSKFNKIPEMQPEFIMDLSIDPIDMNLSVEIQGTGTNYFLTGF